MFDADVPLTEPFPGVPTPTPRERPPVSPVRVTKLENGPRVASVDTGDRVSSVGLFVRAGSRYESAGANTGVCSLLEHMAFRGSARRSKFLQTRALEKTSASFGASSSREVLIYSAEGMRAASGTLIAEITEAALQPMVMGAALGTSAWDAARAEIKTQAAAMAEHPQLSAGDASVELNELLHATAYNSVGLGMFLAFFLRCVRLFLRLPCTLFRSALWSTCTRRERVCTPGCALLVGRPRALALHSPHSRLLLFVSVSRRVRRAAAARSLCCCTLVSLRRLMPFLGAWRPCLRGLRTLRSGSLAPAPSFSWVGCSADRRGRSCCWPRALLAGPVDTAIVPAGCCQQFFLFFASVLPGLTSPLFCFRVLSIHCLPLLTSCFGHRCCFLVFLLLDYVPARRHDVTPEGGEGWRARP